MSKKFLILKTVECPEVTGNSREIDECTACKYHVGMEELPADNLQVLCNMPQGILVKGLVMTKATAKEVGKVLQDINKNDTIEDNDGNS